MNPSTDAKGKRGVADRLRLVAALLAVPLFSGLGAAFAGDVARMLGTSSGPSTDESGLVFGFVLGFAILWATWPRHKSTK